MIEAKEFLTDRINTKESTIYVCEYNPGILVGFVQLYPIFSSTRMKRLWLLNDLYINPDFRGQKISVQLIDAAKELALTSNSCGLMPETDKTNTIGKSLYPRTAFKLNKESNFYTWDI